MPVVGICYGMQLMSHVLGGEVKRSGHREYGQAVFAAARERGALPRAAAAQPRLGEPRRRHPQGTRRASASPARPRPTRSRRSRTRRAGSTACCSTPRWCTPRRAPRSSPTSSTSPAAAATGTRARSSRRRPSACASRSGRRASVICALSGGVDSAVAALIVKRAIGSRLTCVFVDNGLLRKDEAAQVRKRFAERLRLKVVFVDASRRFLQKLEGVSDPERKRKIIGREFIEVFRSLDAQDGQGRLPGAGHALPGRDRVGLGARPLGRDQEPPQRGRPAEVDEVQAGRAAALHVQGRGAQGRPRARASTRSSSTASRSRARASPCAASGRCAEQRLDCCARRTPSSSRRSRPPRCIGKMWQSFAVLLPVRSVGVMGDDRTYQYTIALRAVESLDGMTADWVRLPYELLARVSSRIVNEVRGINRVVYDVSSASRPRRSSGNEQQAGLRPPAPAHRVQPARRRLPARRAGGARRAPRDEGDGDHRPRQHVRGGGVPRRRARAGPEADPRLRDLRRDRQPLRASQAASASEAYNHFTLLASNDAGYHNLVKLVSAGYLEGFYHRPRIDKELLAKHSEGLIGLSGCLSGEIAQHILRGRREPGARERRLSSARSSARTASTSR